MYKSRIYILLLLIVSIIICSASSEIFQENNSNNISQTITMEKLRTSKIVEELLDSFPNELEIVSCHISIAGKDIKYREIKLTDRHLTNLFEDVHAGHKIFVEYILVTK